MTEQADSGRSQWSARVGEQNEKRRMRGLDSGYGLVWRRPVVFALLMIGLLCGLAWYQPAVAQEAVVNTIVTSLRQQDLDGDGDPDLAIIDCAFATEHDQVLVYDRGSDMMWADQWGTATDFENDLWLFDAGSDGSANLIVDFHRDGQALVADLYDDRSGDGKISYWIEKRLPVIAESQSWTVRVTAPDGWWRSPTVINYNLEILVDGPVQAAYLVALTPLKRLQHDGQYDIGIRIHDVDRNGSPDYDVRLVTTYDIALDWWGVPRTFVTASTRAEVQSFESYLFWPFLGTAYQPLEETAYDGEILRTEPLYDEESGRPYGFFADYGRHQAPIQVYWPESQILYVGEFIGRHFERNYFIQSVIPLDSAPAKKVHYANHENPFGFYDLDNAKDFQPELQVRVEGYGAHDPAFAKGQSPVPIAAVRYSWDQDADGSWDYGVSLMGRHVGESVVTLPDFSVLSIPYEDLPNWVLSREWDGSLLIASEELGYPGHEGIHAGSLNPCRGYYAGLETATCVITTPRGFRFDYNLDDSRMPQLYISPVDTQLHLFGASHGTWQVNEQEQVIYKDLDQDGFFDHWSTLFEGERLEQLVLLEDFVFYADNHELLLARKGDLGDTWITVPPRNHNDWDAIGQRLSSIRGGSHGLPELLTWFDRISVPETVIHMPDSLLQEVQSISTAEVLLVLQIDSFGDCCELETQSELLSELELRPGTLSLHFDPQALTVSEAVPARLSVEDLDWIPSALYVNDLAHVEVSIANHGDLTANEVYFDLVVESPLKEFQTLISATISVPGQQVTNTKATWRPSIAGTWRLYSHLGTDVALAETIEVHPVETSGPRQVIAIEDSVLMTVVRICLLLFSATSFAVIGLLILRQVYDGDDS